MQKGLHTLIDFTHFFIPQYRVSSTCLTFKKEMKTIILKNRLNIVGDNYKIFTKPISPNGFTIMFLLDESHISTHCYTDTGKLAFDLFTCCPNPQSHISCVNDISTLLGQYGADFTNKKTIQRF